jgi:hypothetical protein
MSEDKDMTGHRFPKSLLSAINENSGGGYFLVVLDEGKNFKFYTESDDPASRRGLLDYADTIAEKLRLLDDEEVDHALMMSMHPELEEMFDFDEDDDEDEDGGIYGSE